MENRSFIVGIGEILWDELPDGSRMLGGAPSNVVFHCRQLKSKALIVSCVGQDSDGSKIQALLKKKNLSHLLHVDPDHPTGTVSVILDSKGSADYTIHENSAWDHIPFDDRMTEAAKKADAVCFGTLAQRNLVSRNSIRKFIHSTRPECLKVYDVNLRQHYYSKTIIEELFNLANIVKLNHEELSVIADLMGINGTETDILENLIKRYNLELLILTKGKDGSCIFKNKNEHHTYRSVARKIVDTVGAGDAYTAAVIAGLLKGLEIEQININAGKIAAFVCSCNGATPALPENLISLF